MTTAYGSWWAGALALSGTALTYFLFLGRTLGVSSHYRRLVDARSDLRQQHELGALGTDAAALQAALRAATLEEMGAGTPASEDASTSVPSPASTHAAPLPLRPHAVPWTAPGLFLLMLVIGGALASALRGGIHLQLSPGPLFERFFSVGPVGLLVLLVGGLFVGFGTQMAGGCTSGHGLSGTARLQPASLAATASFFGAAVVVSLLLSRHL